MPAARVIAWALVICTGVCAASPSVAKKKAANTRANSAAEEAPEDNGGVEDSGATSTEVIRATPASSATNRLEATAPATEPQAPRSNFNPTSGARGTRGIHRIEAASPLHPGDIVLTLGGSYFAGANVLVDGDSNELQTQQISLVWAFPWVEGLELFASQNSITNTNDAFARPVTQTLGDPEFALKYSHTFAGWFGVGVFVSYMAPTSAVGSGLDPEAFRMQFLAMASMAFTSWLELSINAGYILDYTNKLFSPDRLLTEAQIFSAGISQSGLIWTGLGFDTNFNLFDVLGLGPFAEFTMGIGDGAFDENPVRATMGAKFYPAPTSLLGGLLELAVGADIRILGDPRAGSRLPGIPPWSLFGRLTAHLFPSVPAPPAPEAAAARALTCESDNECSEDQRCMENTCVLYKEVVKIETQEVVRPAPTWVVEGIVIDKVSGEPVTNAVVTIVGTDASNLAVDPKSGQFRSYPLPTGEGLVQLKISAGGYMAGETTMPRGKPDEVKRAEVILQPLSRDLTGELKGSLKDARTGKSIGRGQVFVPKLNLKVSSDGEGKFQGSLKSGRYQVLISSPGYITQKKEIEIRPGDTVILNVDLQPKRR